jgi:hypothetical protein
MNDAGLESSSIRSGIGDTSASETVQREALRRIEECRCEGRKWLDLGNLGLADIPDELFTLRDLETLNLGNGWVVLENGEGFEILPNDRYFTSPTNTIESLPKAFTRLCFL